MSSLKEELIITLELHELDILYYIVISLQITGDLGQSAISSPV